MAARSAVCQKFCRWFAALQILITSPPHGTVPCIFSPLSLTGEGHQYSVQRDSKLGTVEVEPRSLESLAGVGISSPAGDGPAASPTPDFPKGKVEPQLPAHEFPTGSRSQRFAHYTEAPLPRGRGAKIRVLSLNLG